MRNGALADLGTIVTAIPDTTHELRVAYTGEDMFKIEIDKVPLEQYPFLSPSRNLAAGFG